MPEIEKALQRAFPHFENAECITPEAVEKVGAEYIDMVMNWAPVQNEITFADQDGTMRKVIWFEGEPECGSFSGFEIPEDADWEVRSTDS